jgi:hypothetical protein
VYCFLTVEAVVVVVEAVVVFMTFLFLASV